MLAQWIVTLLHAADFGGRTNLANEANGRIIRQMEHVFPRVGFVEGAHYLPTYDVYFRYYNLDQGKAFHKRVWEGYLAVLIAAEMDRALDYLIDDRNDYLINGQYEN